MKFVATERSLQGTGASRRLRNAGRTPGIIYGAGQEPQMIELNHNDLWHALKKEAFHSVLDLEVSGKAQQVLVRDVQYHPYKQLVLHIDFLRVDAKAKLTSKVPLHFEGADESPAVKLDGCLVTTVMTEIEVSCLPANLPGHITVDLSKLVKGDALHVSHLVLPKGVEAVSHGGDDAVVVTVTAPAKAKAAEGEEAAAPAAE